MDPLLMESVLQCVAFDGDTLQGEEFEGGAFAGDTFDGE